jgi:tripartite-type tricarboxylate transporter receptor subunit TctC
MKCFLAVLVLPMIGWVHAQSFPAKSIRFVAIGTPGTTSDVIGRTVAEPLARQLGRSIVVDPRGGAGGTIAAGVVARSEPDGYTLLVTASAQSGMTWLYANLPFDPVKNFSGVAPLAELPSVLVVPMQRNWLTMKDLIAAAKATPGALNYGSSGTGSGTHLFSEKLMMGAGITANHVPYKGTSETLVELIAGRLDWIYMPAATAVSLINGGRIRGLIVSSKTRMAQLPDIPTAAEAGMPEGEHQFWFGLLAPRKTPRAVVNKLNEEIVRVLKLPELRERYHQLGMEPFLLKPEAFDAFLAADTAAMGRIVKAANIKPQ